MPESLVPPGHPGLDVLFFVGFCLWVLLGARFATYAALNARRGVESRTALWRHLAVAGALGTVYGVVGLVDLLWTTTGLRDGVALAAVLALALAVRALYASGASERLDRRTAPRARRLVEGSFVAVALGLLAAGVARPSATLVVHARTVAAGTFVVYGLAFATRHVRGRRLGGSLLDVALRHVLPVLVFGGLLVAADAAGTLGLRPPVVAAIRALFLVMTATALMSAAVVLQQSAGGLRS